MDRRPDRAVRHLAVDPHLDGEPLKFRYNGQHCRSVWTYYQQSTNIRYETLGFHC